VREILSTSQCAKSRHKAERANESLDRPPRRHFEVTEQKKSPAKPLQYLIALTENTSNCRRPVLKEIRSKSTSEIKTARCVKAIPRAGHV
jgi:hypothetical protein